MPAYRVQFLKHVYDHRGFDHRICQASFEVEARLSDEALTSARRLFCLERKIPTWHTHADETEIELLAAAGERREVAVRREEFTEMNRRVQGRRAGGRLGPRPGHRSALTG